MWPRVWFGCLTILAVSCALVPSAADARTAVTLDAKRVLFFADVLSLVARDGATVRLGDGTIVTGDSAFVDLRTDRAIIAGNARARRGAVTLDADVLAIDVDGERVDALRLDAGATRTTRALGAGTGEPIDAERFAFPDLDESRAYIRSRDAQVVAKTSVRFRPAAFPTSVGAAPVPMYLYTYAASSGFAATSLPGASFDQPYGLIALPNSLTSAHARWNGANGASLALQQHLVDGDNGFVAASIDAPLRATNARGLNAYRRIGSSASVSLDAAASGGNGLAHAGFTRAFGLLAGRLDYTRASGDYSSLVASMRTISRPLVAGATWNVTADIGFDARPGGLLTAVPDRARYATLWHHRLDGFVASPVVRGPFGTQFAATADLSRTWYSFPHHFDALQGTATVSKRVNNAVTLFAGYVARYTADVYPNDQAVFYAPIGVPLPDGGFYSGYSAFSGATTGRIANLDVQYTPNPNASARISYRTTRDFPQFDGFGRPAHELRADLRMRPFPNFGIVVGRSYDFGWGGMHFAPTWTFSVTP